MLIMLTRLKMLVRVPVIILYNGCMIHKVDLRLAVSPQTKKLITEAALEYEMSRNNLIEYILLTWLRGSR